MTNHKRGKVKLFQKQKLIKIAFSMVVLIGLALIGIKLSSSLKPQAAVDHPTYLISYGAENGATPDYIAKNIQTIELNYPYDGQGIRVTGVHGNVMRATPLSYSTIKSALQPLFDMSPKPTKLKHNLFIVYLHDPGDMFDDTGWNVAAQNFANYAQVLKELKDSGFGVDGIMFDNEGPYSPEPSGYWNYGNSTYFRTSHTLAEYQTQTALRGKQIMQAMVSKFPDINFMVMHSSDISCTDHDWYPYNETIGSFNVGLMEGTVDTNARFIDGGEESYGYTTESQFINSYNFRKTGIVNHQPQCSFIPTADRSIWSQRTDVGFGLYNGYQTSSTIGNAAKYALAHSDNFVWFYVEGVTTIGNVTSTIQQIGQDWTDALAAARLAVPNPTATTSPIPSPSPSPSPTPTPTPTPTPSPSMPSPSPLPSPTSTPIPTPTPSMSPSSQNNVSLIIELQGRISSATSGINLKVYIPGTTTLVLEKNDITTDLEGNASFIVDSLSAGNYDLAIKVNGYLVQKLTNRLVTDSVILDFGELRAGDLNNDTIVDGGDWAVMSGKWRSPQGGLSDLNADGIVDGGDWSIMSSNWRKRDS